MQIKDQFRSYLRYIFIVLFSDSYYQIGKQWDDRYGRVQKISVSIEIHEPNLIQSFPSVSRLGEEQPGEACHELSKK
jgi:hypothetical protein